MRSEKTREVILQDYHKGRCERNNTKHGSTLENCKGLTLGFSPHFLKRCALVYKS